MRCFLPFKYIIIWVSNAKTFKLIHIGDHYAKSYQKPSWSRNLNIDTNNILKLFCLFCYIKALLGPDFGTESDAQKAGNGISRVQISKQIWGKGGGGRVEEGGAWWEVSGHP
jgi:hypothetical protein